MTYVVKLPTHISYIADDGKHVVPLSLDCVQKALAKGYSVTAGHIAKSGLYLVDVLLDRETDEIVIFDYDGVPSRKVQRK